MMKANYEQVWKKTLEADRILMCCHARPDPDMVGSALAMKLILEGQGKKVTVISGDDPPLALLGFLKGFGTIKHQSFGEVDLSDHDLFLALDSGSPEQISSKTLPHFPLPIPTVVIDHHQDNGKYGNINLIEPGFSSCAEVLAKMLDKAGFSLVKRDIATCLYAGMWSDSGGFAYSSVTAETHRMAGKLLEKGADFTQVIAALSAADLASLKVQGLALTNTKLYFGNRVVLTKVALTVFREFGITEGRIGDVKEMVNRSLSSCGEVEVSAVIYEYEPGAVSVSMRSNNPRKYWDVARIAKEMGGGGHSQTAAGKVSGTVDEAEREFLAAAAKAYPEWGEP